MAVEITISNLTVKMTNLLHRNEIMYLPRLRTRINRSIGSLDECLKSLEGLKGQGYSSKIDVWKIELQKAVCLTENDIDSFLVRTALTKASPILYVKSFSDQIFLNNKMEKIVCKLRKMSEQIQEMSSKLDKKGDSPLQQSASKDGRSDQEQAKPSEDKGVPSSNNLGDSQHQESAKSEDFGEPNISNGRPESDQEQPKLSEDTWVQPTDLPSNNLGDVGDGEVTSEQNISDGRPSQEQTKLPQTDLGDAELESREDVEYTSQQKVNKDQRRSAPPTDLPVISEIIEEVDDTVGQVVSDRNSMTSPRLRRARSILGDETKNPPGKRFLQRSETLSLYDETKIVLVEDKLEELSQLTLNRYAMYFLISVVGKAGSGKTLLVRQIFNQPQTRQNFDKLAFISVSQNFKEREILAEILQQVAGVKDQEKLSFEVLQQKLRGFLARKRYLIVLDDVHSPDVWNKIKLAFPNSLKGSRVILTIRDANVARRIAPTIVLLHLRPLTDEESWKLFLTRVKTDITDLPDFKNLKQEILDKCQGLPLQILVLGGVLASREFNPAEWSKVLKQIEAIGKEEKKRVEETKQKRKETVTGQHGEVKAGKPFGKRTHEEKKVIDGAKDEEKRVEETKQKRKETVTVQHGEVKAGKPVGKRKYEGKKVIDGAKDENQSISANQSVSEEILDPSIIFALGFRDLSPALRACLNYLCFFPKSYQINTRRLFQLWIAEGFVMPLEGEKKATEDVVEGYLKELENRTMIEVAERRSDGRPKTYKVSTTLYDTYSSAAAKIADGRTQIIPNSDIQGKLDPDYYNPNLRSYICLDTPKGDMPSKKFANFVKEVSSKTRRFGFLTVVDLERVYKPVLPKTLGKVLPLLKYVGLRWTFLDKIPESVGDLPYLETLDVKHTNITTLPISIWKAKELQHLYLSEFPFEISIQESSSSCYPSNLQTLWGLLIGNKDPPIEFFKRLTGIRKLGLTCHTESLKELTGWISGLTRLRSLRLRAINEFSEPSGIHLGSMVNHAKLTDLYLLGKLPGAIISELPPNLTNLTLSVSQLTDDPMEMLGRLAELKVLKLLADSYTGKDITCLHNRFPRLEVLKLWMLKELETWNIEQGTMPKLKELEIRYCPKLNKPEGLKHLTAAEVTLTNMNEAFNTEVEGCLGQEKVIKNKHDFYPSWN